MPEVLVGTARRRLTGKRAETVMRLSEATTAVLRRVGYDDLTLPLVAAEAGVARATAYIYFSSKDHLIAEAYWRRMQADPPPQTQSNDPRERVIALLRHLASMATGEPALARAIALAMTSADGDVDQLRLKMGRHIEQVVAAALGEGAEDETVQLLVLVYTGAIVRSGLGGTPYDVVIGQLEAAVLRILA